MVQEAVISRCDWNSQCVFLSTEDSKRMWPLVVARLHLFLRPGCIADDFCTQDNEPEPEPVGSVKGCTTVQVHPEKGHDHLQDPQHDLHVVLSMPFFIFWAYLVMPRVPVYSWVYMYHRHAEAANRGSVCL